MHSARALAAARRRVEVKRTEEPVWNGVEEGSPDNQFSIMRGQATSARRAATRRHRVAKAALMAQPRTNTYLQRKQRARLLRHEPEPEPEPDPPPQDSVSLWRAQARQDDSTGAAPSYVELSQGVMESAERVPDGSQVNRVGEWVVNPSVDALVLQQLAEPIAVRGSDAPTEGELSQQIPALDAQTGISNAIDSPVIPVEHSSTDIAVAELRREHRAHDATLIGASDTQASSDGENEASDDQHELTRGALFQRGDGLGSVQGCRTNQAVEELRRARDPSLASSVVLNDDSSPWRPLQPGAQQIEATQMRAKSQSLPNDLREMVSVLAAEEVHRCVSVEAEAVMTALQDERKKAETELSAQRELESEVRRRTAEVQNTIADERSRHAEATRTLVAEHTKQAAEMRQEKEALQSRCSELESRITAAHAELRTTQAEMQRMAKCLSDAEAAARAAATEVEALQRTLSESELTVATVQRERQELEASLAAERSTNHETKNIDANRQADVDLQLQALRQELLQQQELTRISDEANSEMLDRVFKAEAVREELESQLAALQREAEERKRQSQTLDHELATSQARDIGQVEQGAAKQDLQPVYETELSASQREVEEYKRQIQTLTVELEAARRTLETRKPVLMPTNGHAAASGARTEIFNAQEQTCSTRSSDWLQGAQRSAHKLAQDLAADDDQTHSQRWLYATALLQKKTYRSAPAPEEDEWNPEKQDAASGTMRSTKRSRRLSQMRCNLSLDSGMSQMSNLVNGNSSPSSQTQRNASEDSESSSMSYLVGNKSAPRSAASTPTVASPSAVRARQRAERNWHLAFSLHEVQSLRTQNKELEAELDKAQRSLNGSSHTQAEHDATSAVDDGSSLTDAVENIRAEVNATAEEQERVMSKLRWIEQTFLRMDSDDSMKGQAAVSCTPAAAEDNAAKITHSVHPLTLEHNPANSQP